MKDRSIRSCIRVLVLLAVAMVVPRQVLADDPKLGCALNGLTPTFQTNWGPAGATWLPISGDPLLIAVNNNGQMAAYVCQPNKIQYQYYAQTSWQTHVWIDGTSKHYQSASSLTPVSHVSSVDGAERLITTVMNMGSDAQLKQVISYVAGSYAYKLHWEITNTTGVTQNDLRFFHGGDTYFGGFDSARSWWNPAQNMVYVNNQSFSTSGIMGFYGSPATPANRYFGGSYSTGFSQAGSLAQLSNTADSNFLDAGYQLQWNRASLEPGVTWVIEAFETWTDPTFLQVLAPADQLTVPDRTVTASFTVHNLDSNPHTLNLAASTDTGLSTSVVGASQITLAGLTRQTVAVQVVVPSNAVIDSRHRVTLTAIDTVSGSGGTNASNIQVFQPNYTLSPLSLDFGAQSLGTDTDQTITLSNSGSTVQVGAIGNTNALAAPFSIVSDNCSGQNVGTGGTCTFAVRFSPSASSASNDVFNVPVLAPEVASYDVSVTGTGAQTCTVGADCPSLVCSGGLCQDPTCSDGVRNGAESDVDCGQACGAQCADGGSCAVGGDCTSGHCRSQHCVPTSTSCWADGDCAGSEFCARDTYACTAKRAPGSPIPNDGAHDGTCASAAAVCALGTCNTSTSTCAAADGEQCTGAEECINDTCTSGHCVPPMNGCWVDEDCANDRYCDRSALTCASKLDAGVGIPSDGLHIGSCADAPAVCTTGACNTTTQTCGSIDGSECSGPSANAQCESNTCTSGHCVPFNMGCWEDADCGSSGYYCRRDMQTCTPKVSRGSPIPADDTLHDGTCAAAADVCEDGATGCNPTTVTCASADSTACDNDNQCLNNACTSGHCVPDGTEGCWLDETCGAGRFCDRSTLLCQNQLAAGTMIPDDGLHNGGCEDAPSVCGTSTCNTATNTCALDNREQCSGPTAEAQCGSNACVSGRCVPGGGNGCWQDSDCGGNETQYCDGDTLLCVTKLGPGDPIPPLRLADNTPCSEPAANVCETGLCNAVTNTCALSDRGQCEGADECLSNRCAQSGYCVPEVAGCYEDSDCDQGTQYCDRNELTCTARLGNGEPVPAADGYHSGTCSDAPALCESGKCNSAADTCADDSNVACTASNQCTNNVCAENGLCGVATGESGCTTSNGESLCQSATCSPSGYCVPSGGSGCWVDSDCTAQQFCDRSTLMCASKLGDGDAIPSDGLHDGRCTQPNARALCASENCNPTTNTCAGNNGTTCTVAAQCVQGICGSNGLCGLPNGAGPCDQSTARYVCQSSTCSDTGGVCVASLAQSCKADSDCAEGAFCDGTNFVCVAKLANGAPLPADDLHAAGCSAVLGAAVCQSGSCNVSVQRCAAATGDSCSAAADCAANMCGSDGRCGLAVGQAGCTPSNQAQLCQSALCSAATGQCIAADGGCSADPDCLPDGFCDGASMRCSARLASGDALPSDGVHDGTCPSSGLSAVCVSGRCSLESHRCVSPNGERCEQDVQCASGSCGSNQRCGLSPGDSGCQPGSDPRCQSGVCDGDNACLSAGQCAEDADCAMQESGTFCTRGQCVPKLPTGAAIPSDTHPEGCTIQNATLVCESGYCNDATDTCAAARGGSCVLPAQCESNVCAVNGQCGLPNGVGPCTGGDADVVCQSGVCGPNSLMCAAADGCASEADCPQQQYCSADTFTCVARLLAGQPLPVDALHDGLCTSELAQRLCDSGECNKQSNTCALGAGEQCDGNADCANNVCAADGMCGRTSGEPCTPARAGACRSGVCSASTLRCIPAQGCGGDSDCDLGDYCDITTFACEPRQQDGAAVFGGVCPDSGVTRHCASGLCNRTTNTCGAALGAPCTDAADCHSEVCGENGQCGVEDGGKCLFEGFSLACQSGDCAEGFCAASAPCSADTDCLGGYCHGGACHALLHAGEPIPDDGLHGGLCTPENASSLCVTGLCNDTTNTCAGGFSAACASADFCVANVCGNDGRCGLDTGEGRCSDRDASRTCRSGLCSAVGVCRPSQSAGCAVDTDCTAGTYCDRSQYLCVPRLAAGALIPSDGLHDGICSTEVAALVCISGVCNPNTHSCGLSNGGACTAAEQCVQDVCGANGQCGIQEGDMTCTTAGQARCQTGRCSATTGRCIVQGSGCAADADCGATQYCDPSALRCKTKLAAGVILPNDALHSGDCDAASAAALCQTGACNPITKTCALANSASCDRPAVCVSNVCGSNARCGRAVGDTGCTAATQIVDCQSGYCAASGACVPAQGCYVDSDCDAASYCNRTAHSCATKLAAGSPLPRDGIHVGTCGQALASAVCSTARCNPRSNTCASSATAACTAREQCVSNVCAANGKCGLTDGAGGCHENADCQSGQCQTSTGTCVASTDGCTRDEDCADDAHCDVLTVRCVADLPVGMGIPEDAPTGGRCTPEVAQSYCASGACNPDTDTCAELGGGGCASDADCVGNRCIDGRCGSPDGAGECSEASANALCASRRCQTDLGRCVAAENGCGADSECSGGGYCDGSSLACVSLLSVGSKLPKRDAMHGASCTREVASAVCDTGECNAVTDACAHGVGSDCDSAADCASNACVRGVCVPTSEAPPAAGLAGGRCSISRVAAGGLTQTAALLGLIGLLWLRRRRRAAGWLILTVLLLTTQRGAAQQQGFATDLFNPAERGSEWFAGDTLDFRGALRPAFGVVGSWAYRPLVSRDEAGDFQRSIVRNQFALHPGASLVVAERVRVGLDVPVYPLVDGRSVTVGTTTFESPASSAGLGDIRLAADLRLVGEYGDPFTMAVGAQVFLPSGDRDSYLGDGVARVLPQISVAGDVQAFVYSARVGVGIRPQSDQFEQAVIGSYLSVLMAAGVRVADKRLVIGPEFISQLVFVREQFFKRRSSPMELMLGAHYTLPVGLRIGVGFGVGVSESFRAPQHRGLATLEWAPPITPPPAAPPVMPDEPLDRDGDGVSDALDACPDQVGERNEDPARNGCPLPIDRDHDSIVDPEDACPDVAGEAQYKGCPPPDRDGDKVLDQQDACPDQAGEPNSDARRNGCPPPPDRDGDGIVDAEDACPDAAGLPAADPKRNGCPKAFVEGTQIKILDQVKFQSGKANILPGNESQEVLEAVLKVLNDHPEVASVRIEGHTDSTGSAARNRKLSQQRAQAVLDWLVQRGVERTRLSSAGFGPDRPIDTNDNEIGRQNNRRVEFQIISQEHR